jgi:hypothetical protein
VVKGMQQLYHGATATSQALGDLKTNADEETAPVRAAGAETPDRHGHR